MATNNMTVSTFYARSGKKFKLGKLLSAGGEGAVYKVSGCNNLVAKIIHPNKRSKDRTGKMLVMDQLRTNELESLTAWPLEILYENKHGIGEVCGFAMKFVDCAHVAHEFFDPQSRRKNFPNMSWKKMLWVACNLAKAFAVVHRAGHVIGDVNENNFIISKDGTVSLIDIDGIQIKNGNKYFICEVGVVEYTPPELQGHNFTGSARTSNHDCFGLAVLIFKLLIHGKDPFSGMYSGQPLSSTREKITQFHYAWARQPVAGLQPPMATVPALTASPRVADLWERAFGPEGVSGRPSAGEWVLALTSLLSDDKMGGGGLAQCPMHPLHQYYARMSACPWCVVEQLALNAGLKDYPFENSQNITKKAKKQIFHKSCGYPCATPTDGAAGTAADHISTTSECWKSTSK